MTRARFNNQLQVGRLLDLATSDECDLNKFASKDCIRFVVHPCAMQPDTEDFKPPAERGTNLSVPKG